MTGLLGLLLLLILFLKCCVYLVAQIVVIVARRGHQDSLQVRQEAADPFPPRWQVNSLSQVQCGLHRSSFAGRGCHCPGNRQPDFWIAPRSSLSILRCRRWTGLHFPPSPSPADRRPLGNELVVQKRRSDPGIGWGPD